MLGLALVACGGNAKHSVSADDTRKEVAVQDGVEVLYFHGKQRCATCMAIEQGTREVMENELADAVGKGEVKFRVVDISLEENEAIAEKYEVTWSSLFVVKHKGGTDTAENLTEQNGLGNSVQERCLSSLSSWLSGRKCLWPGQMD